MIARSGAQPSLSARSLRAQSTGAISPVVPFRALGSGCQRTAKHECRGKGGRVVDTAHEIDDVDADIMKSNILQRGDDRIDARVTIRELKEGWRVNLERGGQKLGNSRGHGLNARSQYVEEIAATWLQYAARLAIRFGLVDKEHDAELADRYIERVVRKRQVTRVGGSKLQLLLSSEFCLRDFHHRRVQIGGSHHRAGRQKVTQQSGNDARPGCRFEDAPGVLCSRSARDLVAKSSKQYRAQAAVIMLRYVVAGEAGETVLAMSHGRLAVNLPTWRDFLRELKSDSPDWSPLSGQDCLTRRASARQQRRWVADTPLRVSVFEGGTSTTTIAMTSMGDPTARYNRRCNQTCFRFSMVPFVVPSRKLPICHFRRNSQRSGQYQLVGRSCCKRLRSRISTG